MRLLHLSDFHFKKKTNLYDQEQMVEELIKTLSNEEDIDLVVFSGDLVFSGADKTDFTDANTLLIRRVLDCLKLSDDKLVICQGNHDINRNECTKATANHLYEELKDTYDIDNFHKKGGNDFINSLKPSENYFEFVQNNYKNNVKQNSKLVNGFRVDIKGVDVGILTINSAWVSSEFNDDKGALILPMSLLKNTYVNEVKQAQVKIFVTHHPLDHFKEMNYRELEQFVYSNFTFLLNGHEHREKVSISFSAGNSILCNCSDASLSLDRSAGLGFSIVNYPLNTQAEFRIDKFKFIKSEGNFIKVKPLPGTLAQGDEKIKLNKLREKVISKFDIELEEANKLLVDYDKSGKNNFLDNFNQPILSDKSEDSESDLIISRLATVESLRETKNNIVIYGDDKSGKTSLLKKIQLDYLSQFANSDLLPLYLDYDELSSKRIDVIDLVRKTYDFNIKDATNILNSGRLVLLLDNVDTSSVFHEDVLIFLGEFKDVKFIMTKYNSLTSQFLDDLDELEFSRLYLKDLTRTQIREYTEKKVEIVKDQREVVIDKVTAMCKQLNLPINYWTVSLLLFIHSKSKDDNNLYEVLDSMIDEVLKKNAIQTVKLNFDQYKLLCSVLAYKLYQKYEKETYSIEIDDLLSFLKNYTDQKPRITASPEEIYSNLLSTGLLTKRNGRYSFRLRGIFEYFLAYYISTDEKVRTELLSNEKRYLAFKNEWELYSGINRQDKDFVSEIFHKTQFLFKELINKYTVLSTPDDSLKETMESANQYSLEIEKLKAIPMAFHDQDQIKDHLESSNKSTDVEVKEDNTFDKGSFENLEGHLMILSRVFRNSDGLDSRSKINEIFNFTLDAYCSLGFVLADNVEKHISSEGMNFLKTDEVDKLIDLLRKFIPVVVQSMMHNGLGHKNFEIIILEKIKELRSDIEGNQYKLFLLYFLLVDADISHLTQFDEFFEDIKMSALQYSTLLKLKYYMSFKAYGKKKLEADLEKKIQKVEVIFQPKEGIKSAQKHSSQQKKSNLLKE